MRDQKTLISRPKIEGMTSLLVCAEPSLVLEPCVGQLWESLDSELWQTPQNPWVILRSVSERRSNLCWPLPPFVNFSRMSTP